MTRVDPKGVENVLPKFGTADVAVSRHLIVRIVGSRKCLKLLGITKAANHEKKAVNRANVEIQALNHATTWQATVAV